MRVKGDNSEYGGGESYKRLGLILSQRIIIKAPYSPRMWKKGSTTEERNRKESWKTNSKIVEITPNLPMTALNANFH